MLRFVRGWDALLIQQLNSCSEVCAKPVISTYPAGYSLPDTVSCCPVVPHSLL